ncbi:GntR family transcriptional regulator [Leucobacter sp. NPDC058333]|uniref:GntR family transcriptional regulator n=1 Tax=Leucobacter sp. NPDC058333 TaxID=3346450 RepID=UPI0036461616
MNDATDRSGSAPSTPAVPGTGTGTGNSDSAALRAYAAVLRGILTGKHAGGDMLSESTIAGAVGVSRTPVRAALIRLQDEGWITIYPKRGALVREFSAQAVADLAQTKVLLECGAVRATCPALRRRTAAELRGQLTAQAESLESRDLPEFVELSIAFHRGFVAASRNAVLTELYDRLADRQRFLLFSYGQRLFDRSDEILVEHAAMLDALEASGVAADAPPGAPENTAALEALNRFDALLRHHLSETYRLDP